jgi:hydrogenase maturation protein HypF
MNIFPFTSRQAASSLKAEQIRVQGTAQGEDLGRVVYRLAKQLGLRGQVRSLSSGTEIVAVGQQRSIERLLVALRSHLPQPLAHPAITREPYAGDFTFPDFDIVDRPGALQVLMSPNKAICLDCQREVFDPASRYYRYPFTSCDSCSGSFRRLGTDDLQSGLVSPRCPTCEQGSPEVSRRPFQAATVCPQCGPQVWLESFNGPLLDGPSPPALDDLDRVCALLLEGKVVAIKGLTGLQLACDATNEVAVRKLRQPGSGRPLTLMARDLPTIERYCRVDPEEKALLESAAAPAVLLTAKQDPLPGFWLEDEFLSFHRGDLADQIPLAWEAATSKRLPLADAEAGQPTGSDRGAHSALKPIAPSVAPGQQRLGFMLPYSSLHHLILHRLDRPIVLTSDGLTEISCNLSPEQAQTQLAPLADAALLNDLEITNPVSDALVQVCQGQMQILQRGRGYASCPIWLPEGFDQAPPLLALGSDHHSSLCRLQAGQALISQPLGDIRQRQPYQTYRQTLDLFRQLFADPVESVAVDQQPSSRSTQLGLSLSQRFHEAPAGGLRVQSIQHHHAHIAACMAENGLPLKTPPILGIALDGMGFGDDGTLWGGEFLLADYRGYRRLAALKPVALLGGEAALYQPWRSTYAHLRSAFDWAELLATCSDLELIDFLANKAQMILEMTFDQGTEAQHSPLASSAGRLFDAVAAAVGLCREEATYESQGAVALEALIEPEHLQEAVPYPFEAIFRSEDNLWILEPRSMWLSLLADLMQGIDAATIAARFHVGLAAAIAALTQTLQQEHPFALVALSGGVFQNQVLTVEVKQRLEALGLTVLTHSKVPPNDGGLSLGQAVIAAARQLESAS